MALYQKYRPQKFSQVVGQNHIKKILTNALRQGRISHAYLFAGPRGVGKTTLARLVAKSLNCQERVRPLTRTSRPSYEPCDKCLSCRQIKEDRSLDVIEIDAASNRGIDEIRELREKIRFSPSGSKFKIYIIDEVHMLTREAFNALLKTLEEPPRYVIFIMATTEPHRVPETIVSRAQELDFKKANSEEILENLKTVVKAEGLTIDAGSLELISRYADGSYRDALSLLDQVASLGVKKITLKEVQEILGLPPKEMVDKFLNALDQRNPRQALELIKKIDESGYDLSQFANLVIEGLRQKMLDSYDYSVLDQINLFLKAKGEIKYSNLPQLPLEISVIKICGPVKRNSSPRIKKIKNRSPVVLSSEQKRKTLRLAPIAIGASSGQAPSQKISLDFINNNWPKVLEKLKPENHSLALILSDARPLGLKDNIIQLAISNKFYAERLREPQKYEILSGIFEKVFGQKLGFECIVKKASQVSEISQPSRASEDSKTLVKDIQEVFEER